jgi:hypothetical protein
MIYLETIYMGKKLLINKNNGIYGFIPDSGKGKIYVYYLLEKLGINDMALVTYHNDTEKIAREIELATDDTKQYRLIYLDRADMYMTEELYNKLLKLSKHTTIMMNLKGIPEYAEHTLSVVTVYCDDTEIRVF